MKKLLQFGILLYLFLSLSACQAQKEEFDILIRGAEILDGTGRDFYLADVGLNGERIAYVGKPGQKKVQAKKVIEAEGYILSPGFIDVHTHSLQDVLSPKRKANLNYLRQGVTTVVTGNDGGGPVEIRKHLEKMDSQGVGTNVVLLVGHGQLRKKVMGMSDEVPTPEQMAKMKSLLKKALQAGAFGMSTGLYYTPGNFAKTEEVIELAKLVKEEGGIYDSHIRDESSYSIGLLGAIKESIEIARKSGVHVNISHIKALGVDVWGQSDAVIRLIEDAHTEGLSITADQYPYRASGTSITNALVPRWVFANDFKANMRDAKLLPRIQEEMKENLRRRGGPNAILFTDNQNTELNGFTLEEVAKHRGKDIMPTAMQIILSGGSRIASFNMNPDDIEHFMKQPWVMTSSDGSLGHPRKYGSFPKKIREYVVEKKVMSLAEMVRKSTSLPAQTFQIPERGKIETGYFADLIVFKIEEVKDNATYQEPTQLATGMEYVLVNGKVVIEKGEYMNFLEGKALRMRN